MPLPIRLSTGAFLLFLAAAATPAGAAVILTNGSFEETSAVYSNPFLQHLVGWTNGSSLLIQASSAPAGFEQTSLSGVTGSRFLRLASDFPNNIGITSQNLGTMTAGERYRLTGDVLGGLSQGTTWGALILFTNGGAVTYSSQTLTGYGTGVNGPGAIDLSFTASASESGNRLFLVIRALPVAVNTGARGGIDNLALVTDPVPEPGTFALIGAGLGLIALHRRQTAKN